MEDTLLKQFLDTKNYKLTGLPMPNELIKNLERDENMNLYDKVKERTLLSTGMTEEELQAIQNENESVLHNPFLYDGMEELVDKLHEFKLKQTKTNELLIIDTDYDTDGIMSASVLSAALDVFNINYRVYIPSMADGYGLNPKAVREMIATYKNVGMILTADNGTNAIQGVAEASIYGIPVLVTDHHLGGDKYSDAEVIVNPNKQINGEPEPYPFKGNAGATVAWKAMTAYAMKYEKDKLPLIFDLIVFAGIANVSDMMPIIDENHYMVKESVRELRRYFEIMKTSSMPYIDVKNTKYLHYNTAFHGLYHLVTKLQQYNDDKRIAKSKKPLSLPTDEELISWYLSPLLNAPRRVHATSRESMLSLLSTSLEQQATNIDTLLIMNEEKSKLRDEILDEIKTSDLNENSNVLFVNTQHGISGLIASNLANKTNKATIVFALPTKTDEKVYRNKTYNRIIAGSARSNDLQPLDVIMNKINELQPGIIVGGGGHANAAGYSIQANRLEEFKFLFDKVSYDVEQEMIALYNELAENGEVAPQNIIKLGIQYEEDNYQYGFYDVSKGLNSDLRKVYRFQEDLKPFGKDFKAQTKFIFDIRPIDLLQNKYNLNLDFWKTFKFTYDGVEFLTFNIQLAEKVKEQIKNNDNTPITTKAIFKMNEFCGNIKPQLQLDFL